MRCTSAARRVAIISSRVSATCWIMSINSCGASNSVSNATQWAAIQVLAGMLQSASTRAQLLVATQSVTLVNQLELDDVWVVDRVAGASQFNHLKEADMSSWLEDYGLGELWEKNLLGGRP